MASSEVVGFIGAFVAVIFFGSNFVPIKQYETGDGMFFQWVLCSAILLTGTVLNFFLRWPPFEPFAMLGGVLWCTGNVMTVPIVKVLGLGMGLSLWGMSNLITGWATGHFGLLGVTKEVVPNVGLNIAGFVVACVATGLFIAVKTSPNTDELEDDKELGPFTNLYEDSNENTKLVNTGGELKSVQENSKMWIEKLPPITQRVVAVLMALLAGCFYGVNFDPPSYLIDSGKGHSKNLIDYVFSHYCGVYLSSTVYFVIYCIYMKNEPKINKKLVLPGMVSGCMWAIATVGWFVSTQNLGYVITFPIVATGPGIVGFIWGVAAFGEIRGKRNFIALTAAFVVTFTSVTLITLSRVA